jgi:hypothetical protein
LDSPGRTWACEVGRNIGGGGVAHSAASTHAPTRQKSVASKSGGITRELVEVLVQHSVEDIAEKHLAKDSAAQVPALSDSPAGRKCACEVVHNSVGVRPAHPAAHAPTRQKDASGNSEELSGGITRELAEDIVLDSVKDMVLEFATDMDKQPNIDFVMQLPTRSDNPGRKCACKVVHNSVGVRLAHSAASAHAPMRRKDAAGNSGEPVEDIVQQSVENMVLLLCAPSPSLAGTTGPSAVYGHG